MIFADDWTCSRNIKINEEIQYSCSHRDISLKNPITASQRCLLIYIFITIIKPMYDEIIAFTSMFCYLRSLGTYITDMLCDIYISKCMIVMYLNTFII